MFFRPLRLFLCTVQFFPICIVRDSLLINCLCFPFLSIASVAIHLRFSVCLLFLPRFAAYSPQFVGS
uniref:Uncharacterized protein n=1 Tax=Arundo donax TaxID=35708 RepID=A0A0A9E351_ARUDO